MEKKLKRKIAAGLLMASIFTLTPFEKPKTAEAGWLSDAIGSVIGAATGDKAVRRNSATKIDKILHQALKKKDYDLAGKAIEQGANVNSMFENTFPIEYELGRMMYGNMDTTMADLLISKGADIEGWYDGKSRHYYAFMYTKPRVIKYLIDKGLNVNIKGNCNISLLMQVVSLEKWLGQERLDLIQELVNSGADIGVKCSKEGYGGIVNVDVAIRYREGETALHGAVRNYDIEGAKILLYAGADKNIRNNAGKTPLDIAIDDGKTEMIKLLMDWQ